MHFYLGRTINQQLLKIGIMIVLPYFKFGQSKATIKKKVKKAKAAVKFSAT